MTPEDRATLERVERLLAEAKYDFGSSEVNRDTLMAMRELSEALSLLRGLLAEPQENPSEANAIDEAVRLMEEARGHYGIEECSGPGQPDTEWDEIQDAMQKFVWRWKREGGSGLLAEGEESREP